MERNDERAKSNLDISKDDGNVAGNLVGEGVGGASGAWAGAAIGSLGGPIGTVIGGIAGAIGGWWSGRAVSEAAHNYGDADDAAYREHHTSKATHVTPGRSFDDARPAYQVGHLAGRNPDYANRTFDDVEPDLQRGWTSDVSSKHGEWSSNRNYARDAYDRGRSTLAAGGAGAAGMSGSSRGTGESLADKARNAIDDVKDRMDGNPASRPGLDSTDSTRRM